MATKKPAPKTQHTSATSSVGKVSKKTPTRTSRRKSQQTPDTDELSAARNAFLAALIASGNVSILSKQESERILADTEFNGCIARPKKRTT